MAPRLWISGDNRIIRGVSTHEGGMWSAFLGFVRVPIYRFPDLVVIRVQPFAGFHGSFPEVIMAAMVRGLAGVVSLMG